MARLREVVTDAGFENVATYIQSGNVFFDSSERSKAKLTSTLEQLLEQDFGFAIPESLRSEPLLEQECGFATRVTLLALPQLEKLIEWQPSGRNQADGTQRLLVTFTSS